LLATTFIYQRSIFIMHLIGTLVVGLIAGALAKLIMPGRDPGGIVVTMLLGIAGSFVAGFLGRAIGWYRDPGSGPGITASIVGALILLAIYRIATGRGLGRYDRRQGPPGTTGTGMPSEAQRFGRGTTA
jgi:uncharacterized membrane protein YeaQ/YmgE (transglycosylase-associated protein family)